MSFSTQVKEELNYLQIKNNCCKKAYLFGALLSADISGHTITVRSCDTTTGEKITFLLNSLYKVTPKSTEIARGCYKCTELVFESKRICDFLNFADKFNDTYNSDELLKCDTCRSAFLRGAFCSSGSVSDPQSTYTLEIRTKNESRAKLIQEVIKTWGIDPPAITQRKKTLGLFFRSESSIEDILTACGANNALFSFYDAMLKKDFRNRENRATNCVAMNISRSVKAAAAQTSAIESLISAKAFDDLPEDLKISAKLRAANPDISLSELCELHTPPISKSGLSHRLSRIVDEAKKRKLI